MAVLKVNDAQRRVEYTAGVGEDTFVYNWSIFVEGDLDVYKDQLLLVLDVDYTVTNAGVTGGGDVVLTVAATGGEEIVIISDIRIDQTTDYTIKANFTGQTIQAQFNKLTMIMQDFDTRLTQTGLVYNVFADLKLNNADNILPVLLANQSWQMNATGTGLVAVEFEIDPGANTLRSQLISKQSGSDGALIIGYFSAGLGEILLHDFLARVESKTDGSDGASVIGYFDPIELTEITVKDKLDILSQNIAQNFKNIIIGGDFTTNPFQRGTSFDPISSGSFAGDRFIYEQAGSIVLKLSQETSTPPPVSLGGIFVNKYIRFEVNTASSLGVNDFITCGQKIEGYDWTRVAQRDFTVTFLVRSKITGTFAASFRNVDNTQSYVSNFTIDSVDTWEKKTINVTASPAAGTWDYENGIGIYFAISMGAGVNFQTATLDAWQSGNVIASTTQTNFGATITNTMDFALFQLEEGGIGTSFEVRHFQQELALCQRYFYKSYAQGLDPGTIVNANASVTTSVNAGTNGVVSMFALPVELRSIPTITTFNPVSGGTGTWSSGGGATLPFIPAFLFVNGTNRITIRSDSSYVLGEDYFIHLTAESEL